MKNKEHIKTEDCEHSDFEIADPNWEKVGKIKFPKFMYLWEDHGDGDRVANNIVCTECHAHGVETYVTEGGEDWKDHEDIKHSKACEEDEDWTGYTEEVGEFPKNFKTDGYSYYEKIKCMGLCGHIGKRHYEFDRRFWLDKNNNEVEN